MQRSAKVQRLIKEMEFLAVGGKAPEFDSIRDGTFGQLAKHGI
jgi:hypothetical protein